ncbi:MAG TPA: type II CAAX endopeptidase family protein [Candidatus Acidoferrales bacterium]|nr:type II CAAX endopeptidase family protein [Candidatus Acidoferrales bacterium]
MTSSDPQIPLPPGDDAAPEASYVPELPAQPPPDVDAKLPEDIRTPWGGGELVLFLVFAPVSVFVMDFLLAIFMTMHYHMTSTQLMKTLSTDAPLAVSFQAAWYIVIFAFLFIMIRVYHGAPFWSSLCWRRFRPRTMAIAAQYFSCIVGGVALAVAVGAVSNLVGEKKNLPIEQLFGTRRDVLWLMAFGIGVAPFVEETIFRGFLYPVLARKWGIPAGVVITGILFGGMHAAQLWPAYPQIALLIGVGIVLTFARARSRSTLASWLIHVSYNSFLFAAFFLTTHGLKNIPPIH